MTTTETKTRPILFSSEMVRAILAGRKTMTRRVVKHSKSKYINDTNHPIDLGVAEIVEGYAVLRVPWEGRKSVPLLMTCPYGKPGDRLWVRETWGEFIRRPGETVYKADDPVALGGSNPWRASIHMPRHRSRITLEITGVKVERLQDISREDAMAEGIDSDGGDDVHRNRTTIENFAALWRDINGEESWNANPWVWAITFKRVEA